MRFSLRTLLFVVPAVLIASYWLLWNVQGWIDQQRVDKSIPIWNSAAMELEDWREKLVVFQTTMPNLSVDHLNDLFETQRAVALFLPNELRQLDPSYCTDSWGNPYSAVDFGKDAIGQRKIGIFSKGRDGKSASYGNDPDDVNTWNLNTDYYDAEEERKRGDQQKIGALLMLLIGVFFVIFIWFLHSLIHRRLFLTR